jgi:hypothetical protein
MSVLGVKGQNVILSLMGTAAHELVPIEMDPAALMKVLVGGGAEFVKRGVDGVFCNGDKGDLRPWADEMIAALLPYSSRAT